jgi:beta-mannosidase
MAFQTTTTLLDTGWELAERVPAGKDLLFLNGGERNWVPATVPGHVHPDLVKAGIIGDPFFRMQERAAAWIDETNWTYRTTFDAPKERIEGNGKQFLVFHGLDTVCRIYLNGDLIGATENFFIEHRFDVTKSLQAGENTLRLEFDAPLALGLERQKAYLGDGTSDKGKPTYFNFGPRAFVRKSSYMYGWDWGPELISCGIWGKVEWLTVPEAEIIDWKLDYQFVDGSYDTVNMQVAITVQKYTDEAVTAGAALYAPGDNTPSEEISGPAGEYVVNLSIANQKVERWEINGVGKQRRYYFILKVTQGDPEDPDVLDSRGNSIGFKTCELIQEPDADGKGAGMIFRVNGIDTYMKGANWIPDSTYPGNITDSQLRERLTQCRDAGFNMLRVWGGGYFESETFYALCDEMGILVWQDFPFACSMYPDDLDWFCESVKAEATLGIKRIRHRVSLAMWCGGNENLELHQGRWSGSAQAKNFYGDKIIHEILPEVLRECDPTTIYLPNSPYGGENCASEDIGDSHYWNVWHSKYEGSNGDWKNYALSQCRFSSEFGFSGPAGMNAWESCTLPEDREVRSPVSVWHDKTRKGHETYLDYIEMHFPQLATFEDMVYYGQCNQAEAFKFGVEHWRRLKGRCWGTLIWQVNDCWPTHSWALIDGIGEEKLSYFAAKRFYAPLLLSLSPGPAFVPTASGYPADNPARRELEANINNPSATLVNDTQAEFVGIVTINLRDFAGKVLETLTEPATIAPNGVWKSQKTLTVTERTDAFVHAVFTGEDGTLLAENTQFLAEPKDLALPKSKINVSFSEISEDSITLTSQSLAAFVWARFTGEKVTLSDNGFHLLPGETKTVMVKNIKNGDLSSIADKLEIRSLAG